MLVRSMNIQEPQESLKADRAVAGRGPFACQQAGEHKKPVVRFGAVDRAWETLNDFFSNAARQRSR